MWCPYCGDEMRSGVVRLRGQWTVFPWSGALALNFEVDDGSGEGSEILPRRRFRVDERKANCCVRCEAVLVDPKSGPAPTTSTKRRPAAARTDGEIEVGLSDGKADTADTADGEAPAATTAPSSTNGSANGSSNGNGSGASPATTTDPPASSN